MDSFYDQIFPQFIQKLWYEFSMGLLTLLNAACTPILAILPLFTAPIGLVVK